MMAENKKKSLGRKGLITCIVLVFVAAIGIGGYVWHNTPGFCGTMCHSTMGEHLDNFKGNDASGGAGLASVHAAENLGCLDCHEAELAVQFAELRSQLSGDHDDIALASRYYIDNEKCLSCHEGTYDQLMVKTQDLGDYNPHDPIHGQINCNECHKGHAAQVDTCGQCHPNGGQTMVN